MLKSRSISLVSVCLGAIALSISCSKPSKVDAKGEPAPAPTVAVVKAAREDLSRNLVLAAEFRPNQDIDVHAKVAGFVKEIYVDVGDRVRKDQVLAVLEIPELVDELNQAVSSERRSEMDVAKAQGDYQRAQSVHTISHLSFTRLSSVVKLRPNLVAQQEIDDSSAKDRESEAQVDAAKASLASAQEAVRTAQANQNRVTTLLSYAKITAPFAGVITKRYADTGQLIQSGISSQTQTAPLVRLAQDDRLRLILPVPESIVPRIHTGAAVEVRVPSLNRTFAGRVSRFADEVGLETRTMHTEVDVPNPQLILMPGMYAYATLTLDRRDDALAAPIQAVSLQENSATMLVVNAQNKVEERQVTVGIQTPSKVEVLSGLKEGDLIVVGNRDQVRPGDVVQPKIVETAGSKGEG